MTKVITTETTEQTLEIISSFKAVSMSPEQAREEVSDLLERAITDIESNPLQYPLDIHAQSQGVMLRRWIDKKNKYICLFRYNPNTDIAVLDIFASTRQNYLDLLYLVQVSLPLH